MSQKMMLLMALLSGVCFGSMSWSYQKGRKWNIPAPQIAFVVLTSGLFVFLGYMYFYPSVQGQPSGHPWAAPWPVWLYSILGGIGQAVTIWLIDPALRRGPSAPVFCAMNLLFLPAAIFAVFVLKEHITGLQSVGLASAVGCVVIAGKAQSAAPSAAPGVRSRLDFLMYPLFLVGLMVSSSLSTIVMKQLQALPGETGNLFDAHRGLYLFLTYAIGSLGTGLILTRDGWSKFRVKPVLALGSLAAGGSICGFFILCRVAALPGGVGFAVANVTCFVVIALIAAFGFKERRTGAWYGTILLAILSVLLFAWA